MTYSLRLLLSAAWLVSVIAGAASTQVSTEEEKETSLLGVAVAGAVLLPVVGLLAGAMVPYAMSSFGTVVSGLGTVHASVAAGGVAATLQTAAATLATAKAAAIGGVVGAAVGAALAP